MNTCLMVLPKTGDGYGFLKHHYLQLAKEFESTHHVRLRLIDDPNLLSDLLEIGRDEKNIIVYGWFGYDFQLSCQNLGGIHKVANLIKAKQIAYNDEHPFFEYMIPRLQGISHNLKHICSDIVFKKQLVDLYGVNPNNVFDCIYPAITHFDGAVIKDKKIDVLISLSPMNHYKLDDFKKKYLNQEPLKIIYEKLNLALSKSYGSFDLFLEFSNILTSIFNASITTVPPQTKNMLLAFLHEYDYFVRSDERNRAIMKILAIPGIRVEITQIPLALPRDLIKAHVHEFGLVPFQEILSKTKNSRFILNVCPTFPNQIHERVLYAMQMGCGVITNVNNILAKYRECIYDVDNPNLLEELNDPLMLDAKIEKGRELSNSFNFKKFKNYLLQI